MRQIRLNRTKLLIALIPAVLAVLLPLLWLSNYNGAAYLDWAQTKKILEVIQSAATIAALIAGASWTYFNFFKGRTYRPRLEPKISGQFIVKNETDYLIVTAQLKNVGLSQVEINQIGSAIKLFAYLPEVTEVSKAHSVGQTRLVIVSVFEKHGWIEPGETIEDQKLLALPKNEFVALQVQLRIVSNQMAWNAVGAIFKSSPTNERNVQIDGETGSQTLLNAGQNTKALGEGKQTRENLTVSASNFNKTPSLVNRENPEETRYVEKEKELTAELLAKILENEPRKTASPPLDSVPLPTAEHKNETNKENEENIMQKNYKSKDFEERQEDHLKEMPDSDRPDFDGQAIEDSAETLEIEREKKETTEENDNEQ